MNLKTLEELLDGGHIQIAMRDGRWWRARRNGATKLWKTRPDEFRIPIKAGMYVYGELNNGDLYAFNREYSTTPFRIAPEYLLDVVQGRAVPTSLIAPSYEA